MAFCTDLSTKETSISSSDKTKTCGCYRWIRTLGIEHLMWVESSLGLQGRRQDLAI